MAAGDVYKNSDFLAKELASQIPRAPGPGSTVHNADLYCGEISMSHAGSWRVDTVCPHLLLVKAKCLPGCQSKIVELPKLCSPDFIEFFVYQKYQNRFIFGSIIPFGGRNRDFRDLKY